MLKYDNGKIRRHCGNAAQSCLFKKIISPFHKVVVVSAVGKEFSSDVKTTDLLEKYFFRRREYLESG